MYMFDQNQKYKELRERFDKKFGSVNVKRKLEWVNDYSEVMDTKEWEFYLNHSCDEWVIGSLKDAEEFKKNLEAAIAYVKSFNGE